MADKNADSNMTEEYGMSYKGNLVMDDVMPNKQKNKLLVDNGMYYPVPAVEGIEVLSKKSPKFVYKINRNPLLLMLNALPKSFQFWVSSWLSF